MLEEKFNNQENNIKIKNKKHKEILTIEKKLLYNFEYENFREFLKRELDLFDSKEINIQVLDFEDFINFSEENFIDIIKNIDSYNNIIFIEPCEEGFIKNDSIFDCTTKTVLIDNELSRRGFISINSGKNQILSENKELNDIEYVQLKVFQNAIEDLKLQISNLNDNNKNIYEKLEICIGENKELKEENKSLKNEISSLTLILNEHIESTKKYIDIKNELDNSNKSFKSIPNNDLIEENKVSKIHESTTRDIIICFNCKKDMSKENKDGNYFCNDINDNSHIICKNCIKSQYFPSNNYNDFNNQIDYSNNYQGNQQVLLISCSTKLTKFFFDKKLNKINTIKLRIFNNSNNAFKGKISFFIEINNSSEISYSYMLNVTNDEADIIIDPFAYLHKDMNFSLLNPNQNHRFKNRNLEFSVSINTFIESGNEDFSIDHENQNSYSIIFSKYYLNENIENFIDVNNIKVDDVFKKNIENQLKEFVKEKEDNDNYIFMKLEEILKNNTMLN